MRDPAHRDDLLAGGVRLREGDVGGDRPVEEEVVLEHDAQVLAEVAKLDAREVRAVDQHAPRQRPVEGHDQADERALAGSARAHERRRRSGRRGEGDVLQHRRAGVVFEGDVLERHFAAHVGEGARLASSSSSVAIFRISRMRSSPAKASVICVPMLASWMTGIVRSAIIEMYMKRSPIVICAGADRRAADSMTAMPMAPMTRPEKAPIADTPVSDLRDVAKQPVRALGEDELLALLRRVGLDDPDAAERFGEPAGDLRVDLAALAEERPQALERRRHAAAEGAEHEDRDSGQLPVQIEEDDERHHGGQNASRSAARARCQPGFGCLRRRS